MSPGVLDEPLVRRHLLALDHALQQLGRHAERRLDPAALDEVWAVERGLQVCIQNCLDVATHLAAAAGRDVPDYATAIDRLAELGIVSPEFARRFRGIAGFRNVLVHGYLEVDLALVERVLHDRLEDFRAFARDVERHLAARRA